MGVIRGYKKSRNFQHHKLINHFSDQMKKNPKKRAAAMPHLVFSFLFLLLLFDNSHASNQGLSDELRFIHHEIGFLRNENQQQNAEISLLKKLVMNSNGEGGDSTHQNSIIKGPDHQGLNRERLNLKRPARLLPLQLLFNRNCTTCSELPPRFYGPPTNCSDLTRLGYTLNGFYLVKTSFNNTNTNNTVISNEIHIETVYCSFKQVEGTFNASLVEKRIPTFKSEGISKGIGPLKLVKNKNVINFRSQPDGKLNLSNVEDYKIVFDDVTRNVGKGFNRTTGAFVAPKSGVYQFIFKGTLLISPNHSFNKAGAVVIDIHLMAHDDSAIGSARYVMDSDYSKELGIEETLKLNRGEKVYLFLEPKSSGNLNYFQLDGGKSSFSGFLLHEFDE